MAVERNSEETLKALSLVQRVCKRPRMYAPNNDFYAITAFIDGYMYASPHNAELMKDFNKWLAHKLGFPQALAWMWGIKDKYPDSEEALGKLSKLFAEFVQYGKDDSPE
jgi:hypothetical protein